MLKEWLISIKSINFNKILVIYFCSLIGLVVFWRYFINFIFLWVLINIAYLLLVMNLKDSWLCQKINKVGTLKLIFLLFVIAILLRLVFLSQKPVLSSDLEYRYVLRSQLMLNGKFPYRDFDVNKPPLYAYLLYFMGLCFGAGQLQFRIFFSLIDSLIPSIIYLIGSYIWNKKSGIVAAFAYVFCPITFLEVGLSGHYDPVPILFVTISFFLLLKEKSTLSGLFLGLAFAFKIYPIVLVPFYLIWFKSRKKQRNFIAAFPIPMILSIIPILIVYPQGLIEYLTYQTVEWQTWGPISGPLVQFFGPSILNLKISIIVLFVFLFLIILMFYMTAVKKKSYKFWVKLLILTIVFMDVLFILEIFKNSLNATIIGLVIIISIVILSFVYFPLSKYLDPYLSTSITPKDNLLIQSVFAITLLIFGSAQAHPWYWLWILPFVVLIKTKDLKWFFLILLMVMYPGGYLTQPRWISGWMYP